jgi:hypothetical protein
MPDGRDLRILAKIGRVINNKELAHTFIGKETFCKLSFIRIDGRGRNRYDIARFVLGRYYCSVGKTQKEEIEGML